jgi:uncharacterized protein YndB with AHSA1/START domain
MMGRPAREQRMADILQDFPIEAPPARVFAGVTEPALLDQWWTLRSSGRPALGSIYELDFGPGVLWRAVVTRSEPDAAFELQLTEADADWTGTRVGFEFAASTSGTAVRFYHRDWPEANDHHRASCHCWALYLRVLRRYLEFNETVPYDRRLD